MPGVIFDLDGVIIDSEALQFAAYVRVLSDHGVEITRDEYARHWIAAGGGPEYVVRRYGLAITPDELRARKHPIYHEILREQVTLMPGAAAALERLSRDFPLVLATNSNRRDTHFALAHFALEKYFRAVITRECYERQKPDPDAFLAAVEALDRSPARCVVVEDAYKGVEAAARAGCPCIAVPNAFTRDNDFRLAVRVVPSLDELTLSLIETVLCAGPPSGVPDSGS